MRFNIKNSIANGFARNSARVDAMSRPFSPQLEQHLSRFIPNWLIGATYLLRPLTLSEFEHQTFGINQTLKPSLAGIGDYANSYSHSSGTSGIQQGSGQPVNVGQASGTIGKLPGSGRTACSKVAAQVRSNRQGKS